MEKHSFDYDVIIIGSGPGGEGAAMSLVKEGLKVAVVDKFYTVGGNCTHTGTIPSKALRQAIQMVSESGNIKTANYQKLLKSAESVIDQQVKLRTSFYDRNQVTVINGRAEFIDKNTIKVTADSLVDKFSAAAFIIATGSSPYRPMDIDFTHPRICDSDTILRTKINPRSIIIYGAGVIGCEYASIFRGLQVKVNLINNRDQLLSFLDDEISDALSYHLRETGVVIRNREEYTMAIADENQVVMQLESNKTIVGDLLLWAQGRTGNSSGIGLEILGIETDNKGYIKVDSAMRTTQPHIYAVGDIIGLPSLASAAYDQGRFAAIHLIQGICEHSLVKFIPTGIYTIPEISSIGYTEQELTKQKIPYEVGHSFFKHLARAQITNRTTGMLKILFHRDTLEILGIHCFGSQASEIIHIGQAIFAQKGDANTILYFINTTFNYPTMAEAYRVAALNGLNRVNKLKNSLSAFNLHSK